MTKKLGRIQKASAVAVLVMLAASGCSKEEEVTVAPARPVYVFTVESPTSDVQRSFSGLVKPVKGASLGFEVPGRIVEIQAKSATRYKQGEILARLDATDFETQLAAAEAQLTEATQALRRTQTLFESGNASRSVLEGDIARERSARSNFESAEKKVADCVLRMPYDGVIETIPADAQEVVSAGQEVMTLQGESGMEFKIGLPAADVGKVELGMKATVTVRSLAGAAMSAEVIKVAAQPSENSTYEVTLALNGDMDPQLRSGMDGEAELKLPNAGGSVISVPIECVVGRGSEDTYVWLVEGEADARRIRKGPVTTGGLAGEGQVEVREGLKPGDVIVSRGVHRVEEGMAVAVTVEK